MSAVAEQTLTVALADALGAKTQRYREKTKLASSSRRNAEWHHGVPSDEIQDISSITNTLIEVLNATNTQQGPSVDSVRPVGGEDGGPRGGDRPGGPASGPARPDENPDTKPAAGERKPAGGPSEGSVVETNTGTDPGVAAGTGTGAPSAVRTTSLWKTAGIPVAAATGAAGLTALGMWLGIGEEPKPPVEPPAITQPAGDSSLYQWLEDNNYHLPPGDQ